MPAYLSGWHRVASAVAGERDRTDTVPAGHFPDLGYPRYAPRGDLIALMAPSASAPSGGGLDLGSLFGTVARVYAHGFLFDVWLINIEGSGLRRLAQVSADDGSVAWSPGSTQLFVYGAIGSFLVDGISGEVTPLPYIAGAGGTVWLPQ